MNTDKNNYQKIDGQPESSTSELPEMNPEHPNLEDNTNSINTRSAS